jgi:Uma2 family endonuclease
MLSPMTLRAATTADALPRHPFTVADVERMVEAGILAEDDRVELIDGDLVTMSPKGIRHEILKVELNMHWARSLPAHLRFAPETTFRMSPNTYLEPDFVVFPRSQGLAGLSPATALLAVEVSDTSLGYDLGVKPRVYARFGVGELWVVDAVRLVVHVHRDPGPDGYGSIRVAPASELLVPFGAPELALRLADLDLGELGDDR